MTPLQQAAQAVIDRWNAPACEVQQPTAVYIYEALRKALDAELQQSVKPGAWAIDGVPEMLTHEQAQAVQSEHRGMGGTAVAYPLYLHPPQQAKQVPMTREDLEFLVSDIAEWSSHVEVDTAPTTLTKHVEKVLAHHGIGGEA